MKITSGPSCAVSSVFSPALLTLALTLTLALPAAAAAVDEHPRVIIKNGVITGSNNADMLEIEHGLITAVGKGFKLPARAGAAQQWHRGATAPPCQPAVYCASLGFMVYNLGVQA